jgi:deoxyribodipyrimidine photo-lyase
MYIGGSMNPNRILTLKKSELRPSKSYVLYWMQQSQRVHFNHALEHAIQIANAKQLPVLVYFGLTPSYPEANARHYQFMLEGIKEVKKLLKKLHISFVLKIGSPDEMILPLLDQCDTLVMDYAHLRIPRLWRKKVLEISEVLHPELNIDMVESDLIVPTYIASDKVEYGAFTIRPKIHRHLPFYRDFKTLSIVSNEKPILLISDDELNDIPALIESFNIGHTVTASPFYKGGYLEASKVLSKFITKKAPHYLNSNDPSTSYTSNMSMYLHFGQISSLMIYEHLNLALSQGTIEQEVFDAYIEQLVVRRELAFNYVVYNTKYDQFEHITEPWAVQTMKEHEADERQYLYEKKDYIAFNTHDPYFNAAMKEMVYTGFMHNYMRMYWAKKIIEWSPSYKKAYDIILSLNNTYFIDGRDPNGYTGVAWCFGKHDRAWTERPIFGKLRYMNSDGLKRKFKINDYVNQMNAIEIKLRNGR